MATENSRKEVCNPRIKRILKSYQASADRSLNGPQQGVWRTDRADVLPMETLMVPDLVGRTEIVESVVRRTPTPVQRCSRKDVSRPPIQKKYLVKRLHEDEDDENINLVGETVATLFPPSLIDSKYVVVNTLIEGKCVASFVYAGEPRLCVPDFLNQVLGDFSEIELLEVCERQKILLLRCDDAQLVALKESRVLLPDIEHCGLITKSDAERLCGALLHQCTQDFRYPKEGMKVRHECFGGCFGSFVLEAYNSPVAQCVQCAECGMMLTLEQFVCHSHKDLEVRTLHWGFDSSNWRAYVLLSADQRDREHCQKLLDDMKLKFKKDDKEEFEKKQPSKKICYDTSSSNMTAGTLECNQVKWVAPNLDQAKLVSMNILKQIESSQKSSNVSVPPHLYNGSPVLTKPEQPDCTEIQRIDRHYAPNVSLVPEPYLELREKFQDEEDELDLDDEMSHIEGSCRGRKSTFSSTSASEMTKSANEEDDDFSDTDSVCSGKLTDEKDISNLLESKLRLFKEAMSVDSMATKEERCNEFIMMQKKNMEIISSLQDDNLILQQKVEEMVTKMNNCLNELALSKRKHQEELALLKQESMMKMRDAFIERNQLMKQIDALSNGSSVSELAMMAEQHKKEADSLKSQLQAAEHTNACMVQEIAKLRMIQYNGSNDSGFPSPT